MNNKKCKKERKKKLIYISFKKNWCLFCKTQSSDEEIDKLEVVKYFNKTIFIGLGLCIKFLDSDLILTI